MGHRVVVVIGPASAAQLSVLVPGTWASDEVLMSIDPDDPLVDRPVIAAVTVDGSMLELPEAVAIHGVGEPMATVADGMKRNAVVAVTMPLGRSVVTVIGSTGMLGDDWLLGVDNATFLSRTLSPGRPDSDYADAAQRAADAVAPQCAHEHAQPIVVRALEGWLRSDDVPEPHVAVGSPQFMRCARRTSRQLPFEVWDALGEFVDEPPAAGALLIRGLPVGEVPATPDDPTTPTAKDHTSELVLLAAARVLGQPVGYRPEHGGRLVQNLSPTRTGASRQTSTSSAVPLMFHTEAAFHRHRPRYLALLCLRGDPDASTTLASISEVIDMLPLGARRTLFQPRFRMSADESYVAGRSNRLGRPISVLRGNHDHPTMVFDADLMIGIDGEAHDALGALSAAIDARHVSLVLATGDLLIIDNDRAVHGRSPFVPRYDGTDRWLQRTFVVSDLSPSASERTGRVITTAFGT
jgi:L-asparagine oxygenase